SGHRREFTRRTLPRFIGTQKHISCRLKSLIRKNNLASAASAFGQEFAGRTRSSGASVTAGRTVVSVARLCHVAPETEAENRAVQSATLGGENPSDVAGRSGQKPETSHRPTQPHIAWLGCLLPAHRRKRDAG